MRVTSKGQVTIPQDVRNALGITPGTEVRIERVADHAEIRSVGPSESARRHGEELVALLIGQAPEGVTTDEVMGMTRDYPEDDPGLA